MIEVREIFLDGGRMFSDARFCITDTKTPTFSWSAVSDTDNDSQRAFDITVRDRKTVLWHSGWTESREQSVTYAGKPLPAGKFLDVYVKVRNVKGEESDAFGGQFVCAALGDGAWKGQWITADEDTGLGAMYFRRDFKLEKELETACLFVCGIGYHKITINGMDADDAFMDPAFSDYRKTCYYAVLPEAGALLEQQGANVIGVAVAPGWSNNPDPLILSNNGGALPENMGKPMLNAMLLLYYKDGTKQCITTNERWVWKRGAITEASVFDGETYDAGASDPLWDQPCTEEEIAEGEFRPVVIDKGPGGELRPMAMEPIRARETYSPLEVTEPERGTYIIDFGQNIAGVTKLLLPERMKEGQKITLRFAEELDEEGFLFTAPLRDAKQTDTYIASGDPRDLTSWQPQFTYHGFRYVELKGIPLFDPQCIRAVALYTDIKSASEFRCGSAQINAIQKLVIQTEKANIHGILTDCPQRNERMAWMNDATVRFEETPYNFDIGRIFPKIIKDIRDTQNEEGAFCCCSPRISFGGVPADPVCSSYLVAGKQVWYHTGNYNCIRDAFDGFAAWEDCLLAHSTDYIVDYSYYGDWASPAYACLGEDGAHSAVTEGTLMSTGYSYYNCRLLAEFAKILEREEDEAHYTELAEKIRTAFLAKWFDEEHAKVGSGSQACQAFALWLEILPEDKRQAAADLMVKDLRDKDYQFTTGKLCTRYMMDMLAKYGYIDDAYTLLTKETYPSFGYMLQNEATTVWERFELKKNPGMNSHNHPMYGAVGYWFYAYLCGIQPTGRGFERVSVKPYYPGKLSSAQAVLATVKGQISVRWTKRYGKTQLAVQIPFGVTADVDVNGESVVCGSGYHHFEF
ncbi:MAG: glycoside hydrolase family 78 protein [Clostridia bacterium]|nr:glycoside hydrolase family 78 protein [Clostridia bacterium]